MPTIYETKSVDIDMDIDVSFYCQECGAGICDHATIKKQDIYMYPCKDCMKAKDEEIEELKRQITELT